MAKTIEFTAKNVKAFSSWLKRFSSIEKSLLLELNESNKCFIAKSYNEQKSIVKYSKISFSDAGFSLHKESIGNSDILKIGVYDINRIIKSLDHFQTGEFSMAIQYDEIDGGKEKEIAGIAILLKSPLLKMKIDCSSLRVFQYISEDVFKTRIIKTSSILNFDLSSATIDKINSLCDLDKDYDFLDFVSKDGKVIVRGKTFEFVLSEKPGDGVISIYKNQFAKIDMENYGVEFGDNKLVFTSKDSDTITVTSMVEKDKKYEDSAVGF
jgi:hypothetical protein